MRIGYERLFNMGNYEHEKFVVSKEAESEKEMIGLIRAVAQLERDIQTFRDAKRKLDSIKTRIKLSDEPKTPLEKRKKELEKIISDFKKKHNPTEKECKCAFCTGEWENDEWDYI